MNAGHHSSELRTKGWTLIEGIDTPETAAECLAQFGAILPQYDGRPYAHVKATGEYSNLPVSGSTAGIGPHTDGIAIQQPPSYLALYCVQPARCGGGHTNLADGFDFIDTLDGEAADYCRTERFQFSTEGGLLGEKSHSAEHTILENDESRGGDRINFSHNYFCWGDLNPVSGQPKPPRRGVLGRILDNVEHFFDETMQPLLIPRKALLVWDNGRMLHSRGHFDDSDRHLIRYWIS